jgi:hypothetical protein
MLAQPTGRMTNRWATVNQHQASGKPNGKPFHESTLSRSEILNEGYMTTTVKFVKCACEHCGEHFEIPPAYVGSEHECPHCKRETRIKAFEEPPNIVYAKPREEPSKLELPPKSSVLAIFMIIIGVIMIFCGFADSSASKTVFQETQGTLVGIGGLITVGIGGIISAITAGVRTVCIYIVGR